MPEWESWQWKEWRVQLKEEQPGLNKAARTLQKGTTSRARQLRRVGQPRQIPPPQPKARPGHCRDERDGNDDDDDWGGWGGGGSWKRDSWNSWGGGSWQESEGGSGESWHGDWADAWDDDDWDEKDCQRVELKSRSPSPMPSPRNRGRKRSPRNRGRQALESPSSSHGYDRDKELGITDLGSISEEEDDGSSSDSHQTLEQGKKYRQKSASPSTIRMGGKVWMKKEDLEKERQEWLRSSEQPMHHKQLKSQANAEEEAPPSEESAEKNDDPKGEAAVPEPDASEKRLEEKAEPGDEEKEAGHDSSEKREEESSSSESSDSSGAQETTSEKRAKGVMIDFHNTLEVNRAISCENHAAVEQLLKMKYPVTICSHCYKNRAKEVMSHLKRMSWFERLTEAYCTEGKCGKGGKADQCLAKGISVIMDDSPDICQDAFEKGLQVFPIQTWKEKHAWWKRLGKKPYPTLAHAINDFVQSEMEDDL